MTYVSKKEKVFALPDQDQGSSVSLAGSSDHRLKILTPTCDRGCTTLEECLKHQKLCDFINGKEFQTNGSREGGFKYVPIDVLLTILTAEKDAYIRELLERLDKCSCGDQLFKGSKYEESEVDKEALIRKDAEVVALKNKIAALETELEECKETLANTMQKLENVEDILNENVQLSDKLKLAEEMITIMEENKKSIEIELENYRIIHDGSIADPWPTNKRAQDDCNIIQGLFRERAILKKEIEILQKELTQDKANIEQMGILKSQSETILMNLEKLSKENECYRRKIEGMKILEKCVEDLRKQGLGLYAKYKREMFKSREQAEQINTSTKELQALIEERAGLLQRVSELSAFESEYYFIKSRLNEVNQIINENKALNSKLNDLDKLKMENEKFRIEIERLKRVEIESIQNKKRILKMERELLSQEKEIDGLTAQIKQLSEDDIEENEYMCLKTEIQRQIEIIKEKENQLEDIPLLQSEICELKRKLKESLDDIMLHKKTEIRLQNELDEYKKRCRELDEALVVDDTVESEYIGAKYGEKLNLEGCNTVQESMLNESSLFTELNIASDKDEENLSRQIEQTRLEKGIEECNSKWSSELIEHNLTDMLDRINKFKELLEVKDTRIKDLECELKELKTKLSYCEECENLRNQSMKLQSDLVTLKEVNQHLQGRLDCKLEEEVRIEKLQCSLKSQSKTVEFFKEELRQIEGKLFFERTNRQRIEILSKLQKEESLLRRKEACVNYLAEIEDLQTHIRILKKLIGELKEENHMLHKMKLFTRATGKISLDNILKKVKAELMMLQNLSKPQLESESHALQAEVKRLAEEGENLKLALEAERKLKDYLEKELNIIQKELSFATKAGSKTSKGHNVCTMTEAFIDQSDEIKKKLNDITLLKKKNEEFVKEIRDLRNQCHEFHVEVTSLQSSMTDLQRGIQVERDITCKQKEELNALNEKIKLYEQDMADLKRVNEDSQQKSIALREELTAKEAEIERTKKQLTDMKNEILKLSSEADELRSEEPTENQDFDLEKESDTILRVEKEFEELRRKLENCRTSEEKLLVLRTKRDNLIVKVNCFESEVEFLKKKLIECDLIKNELEQLKAERQTNKQMNVENEEKLLSDICGLREQLKLQQKEIDSARFENSNLKEKLQELGKILELCKKTNKRITETDHMSPITTTDSGTEAVRVDISTSCEKIGDTISVNEFKLEIEKIENKHKNKVKKLREGNAEKIKKLMAQYEKENKNRNKAYNESLNSIKFNYETDIKKLVERHKSSIIRLQSLHEDEVQELNTNYETQMEAMQTLNENVVNDLTSGAAEKCKLTEKYNQEIKDIEFRFQKLLKEKENQHMTEVANLQDNLNRNINELKEAHKKNVDELNKTYNENIAKLEEKHIKELKTCKKNNMKKIEVISRKYEDLLSEERKKFEEQLQIMLNRLKMGQQGDQIQDDMELVYLKAPTVQSGQNSEFNNILQKIISGGLKCLHFDELMLVHCKTCFATESFFEELNTRVEHDGDLLGNACPHMPLLKEEKEQLLKRIFILENAIAIKQLETHEAIVNLETAEKCRIEELTTLLRTEREKNEELKLQVTNQTKMQTDLKIESYMLDRQASINETNYMEKVKELEVIRAEKKCIEDELQKEKTNSKRLSIMIENERHRFKSQRKKDSDYIEAMRIRLEEALNHEQIMESQLDYEAQFRAKLELELQSLQRSFNLITDQPPSTMALETKMVKDKQNLDQFESENGEKFGKNRVRNKMRTHTNT